MVALDLTSEFDTVNHCCLFEDILDSSLPDNIKKWLHAYLRGRSTFVEFRDQKSSHRKVKQGVPQGSVISPSLFNFYLHNLPAPPTGTKVIVYADDLTIARSGPKPSQTTRELEPYIQVVKNWLQERNLSLSLGKSSTTLFTTYSGDYSIHDLSLRVDGVPLPVVKRPRILGVTFDHLFRFNHHATATANSVAKSNNVLKCLAGTGWGCSKETLLHTYKATGRSKASYGAAIYTPQVKKIWKRSNANKTQLCEWPLGATKEL